MNELGTDCLRNLLAEDPVIEARITSGIEQNRKGEGTIELVDHEGTPVERARVRLKLKRHAFHFGANAFMVEEFQEAEKNAAYEEAFAALFNLAVVPFYWSDSEPERGKPRFAKNSPRIYRRPPIDLLLEFCERHNIIPKGHPLCWQNVMPHWVSHDRRELAGEIEQRIIEIAERYGKRIGIWDVCNEALMWDATQARLRMPERHVELAFEVATRCLPQTAVLTYNDYACWTNNGDYTPLYMLVRYLKALHSMRIDAIGLQFHLFGFEPEQMRNEAKWRLNPRHLFGMLDQYGKLGLPINISEVTLTGRDAFGDGYAFQKEMAERLYRIWFSHPAVNGIIYWNLVDDTGFVDPNNTDWDESIGKAGLLRNNMTPKPAYEAIRRLIKQEWTTDVSIDYSNGMANRFLGFYGDYDVEIETDCGKFTEQIRHTRDAWNVFKLELK